MGGGLIHALLVIAIVVVIFNSESTTKERCMKLKGFTRLGIACLSVGVLSAGLLYGGESAAKRLRTAGVVFTEIMGTPDKGIPQDLLESSQCIVIVPGMKKAAFIIGGNYGRGFMLCRHASGLGWSAPGGVRVEGGSFGFQSGARRRTLSCS